MKSKNVKGVQLSKIRTQRLKIPKESKRNDVATFLCRFPYRNIHNLINMYLWSKYKSEIDGRNIMKKIQE